jgi:hypothetical protein
MSIRMMIQFGLASMLLLFSTGSAWYEGSQILEDPWEWKYTALFSQMENGKVENANDIVPIDHFVYAAKFTPAFPLLMLFSGTYLLLLIGYMVLKRNHKMFAYLLSFVGVLFLVLSNLISRSPTIGLIFIYNTLISSGILLLIVGFIRTYQLRKDNKNEEIY